MSLKRHLHRPHRCQRLLLDRPAHLPELSGSFLILVEEGIFGPRQVEGAFVSGHGVEKGELVPPYARIASDQHRAARRREAHRFPKRLGGVHEAQLSEPSPVGPRHLHHSRALREENCVSISDEESKSSRTAGSNKRAIPSGSAPPSTSLAPSLSRRCASTGCATRYSSTTSRDRSSRVSSLTPRVSAAFRLGITEVRRW